MLLRVSSTCAHQQELKIALHSLWYHHTETIEWSKITKIQFYLWANSSKIYVWIFRLWLHINFTTICSYLQNCILVILGHHLFRFDDTRGCVMQFWPPDDEHMCSKRVEAWNKLILKQKFCASSWLITEINILRCAVRKTSKFGVTLLSGRLCLTY